MPVLTNDYIIVIPKCGRAIVIPTYYVYKYYLCIYCCLVLKTRLYLSGGLP